MRPNSRRRQPKLEQVLQASVAEPQSFP
jgi:hypothetical protein